VAKNAAQAPDALDSVQARHLVVGEHHVHGMLARVFDALQGVGECGDLQARVEAPHDLAQHDPPGGLVVDDQDLERRELGFDRVVNQRKRSRRRRGFHWNSLPGPIERLPHPRSQVQVQLHYIWREIARNPNSLRFWALPPLQAARCLGERNADSISRRTRTASAPASWATSAQHRTRPALTGLTSFTCCARPSGSAPSASESAAGMSLPTTMYPPSPSRTSPALRSRLALATASARKPVAQPVGSPRNPTEATEIPTSSPIRCQRLYMAA